MKIIYKKDINRLNSNIFILLIFMIIQITVDILIFSFIF